MTCPPTMAVQPLPCTPGGGESPGGPVEVAGCCSPSIVTSTLCLPDCTPISLVIRSGCTACEATPDDPTLVGWLDAAGAFTAGPPPAEAGPCNGCGDTSPADCSPTPYCPRLIGMSGPDVFNLPEGAESLTLSIICGQIEVSDCTGEITAMNEGCGTLSWAAPQGGGCIPNTLCTPFTVTVPDGAAVYIHWTEPC